MKLIIDLQTYLFLYIKVCQTASVFYSYCKSDFSTASFSLLIWFNFSFKSFKLYLTITYIKIKNIKEILK